MSRTVHHVRSRHRETPAYWSSGRPALSPPTRSPNSLRPPSYPAKLRTSASERWYDTARATLAYAKANHAPAGRPTEVAGALATAAMQSAHAVLAARGEWVTNEKRLLERAELRTVDRIIESLSTESGPDQLSSALTAAQSLFESKELGEAAGR